MKKDKLKKIADYSNNANNFKAKKSQRGGKEKSVVCPDFGMTHANLVGTLSNVPEYLLINEILQMDFYYPSKTGRKIKKPIYKSKPAISLVKKLLSYIAYYTVFSKFDNKAVEIHNETIVEFANGNRKIYKESNAYLVKKKLEDKTLHLPKDTDIIADFSNIQKIVTPNGVRFESARNESGHGDRYSALANTIEVAESKQPFFFIPTRS